MRAPNMQIQKHKITCIESRKESVTAMTDLKSHRIKQADTSVSSFENRMYALKHCQSGRSLFSRDQSLFIENTSSEDDECSVVSDRVYRERLDFMNHETDSEFSLEDLAHSDGEFKAET